MPNPGVKRTIDHYRLAIIRRREGGTLEQLGSEFDVTRERARQIWLRALRMAKRGQLTEVLPLNSYEEDSIRPYIS